MIIFVRNKLRNLCDILIGMFKFVLWVYIVCSGLE